MGTGNWTEALDEAELLVHQHLQALTDGIAAPAAPDWPELGPLPPELVGRAHQILTATVNAYAEVDAARGQVLAAMHVESPTPAACFLDTRI